MTLSEKKCGRILQLKSGKKFNVDGEWKRLQNGMYIDGEIQGILRLYNI